MKKEIKLTKEQQLEKQKYMHNLENNIKDLEYQINNVNKTNLKINALKNIKKKFKVLPINSTLSSCIQSII